jgi:DNA gyrase subunit A
MAQPWVSRYPLADGKGNFGSIDGFEPADMEFTSARLSKLAPDANRFPLLLANGGPGIPPHNLAEVIAVTVAYIDDPATSTRQLLGHLKGPDFPTGGVVPNRDALPAIYETGSGTILLRGRAHTEPGPDGEQLMITQLPYGVATVGAGGLIEQIADAVHQRTLEGITDLRYDTSDENGLGIVLELALGTDADATVDALHEQTDLQITYPVRLVARVESQPLTLTLRDLISGWVGARLLDRSKDALRQQLLAVAERHSDPRRTAIS